MVTTGWVPWLVRSSNKGIKKIWIRSYFPTGSSGPDLLRVYIGTLAEHRRALRVQRSEEELVLYAANRHPDGTVFVVERPGRHHHCMAAMEIFNMCRPNTTLDQGFITTHGRYLSREQAHELARRAGQIKGELIGSVLTSEDLW